MSSRIDCSCSQLYNLRGFPEQLDVFVVVITNGKGNIPYLMRVGICNRSEAV
ncbi:MAG: hypothetical protein ACO3FE_01085 [Planctomycetaceae bacterium]